MKHLTLAALVCLVAAPAFAQLTPEPTVNYSVALYASTATDPNVSPFVTGPTVYPLSQVQCGLAKVTGSGGTLNNPTKARFDDPADATKDCEINVVAQVAALANGSGYKAAMRANGATTFSPWSAFSNSFNRVPVAPPVVTGARILP